MRTHAFDTPAPKHRIHRIDTHTPNKRKRSPGVEYELEQSASKIRSDTKKFKISLGSRTDPDIDLMSLINILDANEADRIARIEHIPTTTDDQVSLLAMLSPVTSPSVEEAVLSPDTSLSVEADSFEIYDDDFTEERKSKSPFSREREKVYELSRTLGDEEWLLVTNMYKLVDYWTYQLIAMGGAPTDSEGEVTDSEGEVTDAERDDIKKATEKLMIAKQDFIDWSVNKFTREIEGLHGKLRVPKMIVIKSIS